MQSRRIAEQLLVRRVHLPTSLTDLSLTLTRGIALWTALIAALPRVGCICADGSALAYCGTATVNLLAGEREAKKACCCDRCACCGEPESSDDEGPTCPVSGLPCKAVISSAKPTTLVDVVDVPLPLLCVETLVVADDSQPGKAFLSYRPLDEHRPLSALFELGQLLRV